MSKSNIDQSSLKGRSASSEKQAKHLAIADYVRRQIEESNLPPRHMLESEAELCERFDVSRGPVRQALLSLEREGRIYRVSGRGSFVADPAGVPLAGTAGNDAHQIQQTHQVQQSTRLWVFPVGDYSSTSYMLEGLLRGIDQKAAEYGVALTVGSLASTGGIRSLVQKGNVAGIFTYALDVSSLDDELFASVPKIWLMSRRKQWECNWEQPWDIVSSDNDAIGGMAARYLIEKGHTNLAFLNLAVDDPSATNRLPGFIYTGHSLGASVVLVDNAISHHAKEGGTPYPISPNVAQDLVDRLLSLTPRPTGIFIPSDNMTAVIQPLLQKRGVKVGEEMLIISCNNYESVLAALDPRPATIDMNCEEIGRRAGDLMALRMQGHAPLPWVNIYAPPKLILPQVSTKTPKP